ncbi:nucleotide exchange factor GrpE [cyanobacterium endosymbiont of Epithemia clementina EcSB]|uniref:nucleotide exchange factor GrpE n=1 Tax=cyanobacterium endosymbiont of Epithemia clementina EcSB TaxID=3034674 RepID=UPI00247FD48E|nr:nucleotide exchange factor GrpE [cyanobacterium endosymbiont of Epithemia clementina EcSB]WGT67879.1 nucleotide exchange factor GrpE [cyanobacterium endosymbiont of Epithemia clementina EcSB]
MNNEQQQLEKTLKTSEVSKNVDDSSVKPKTQVTDQLDSTKTSETPDLELDLESVVTEPVASEPKFTEEEYTPEQIIATLTQEVEVLQGKLIKEDQQSEVLKKRYIALAAEFDNFRKRTEKERTELEIQVKCRTISELLSVVDNFERARGQIQPANDGELGIHKSYQGVYKNLVESLKRLGVAPMRPEGEPFNPLYHEAMLRECTNDYPEGTVIEQLVRGYLLGEQVLRHAMVKVAAPTGESPVTPEGSASINGGGSPTS